MPSITLAQAALFAGVAMVLLTGHQLLDNAALLRDNPVLLLLGGTVPSVAWTTFFFAVNRSSYIRTVTWITLVFAVFLEALIVCIRFQQAVNYWTPFGNALSLTGWLLRLGWTLFLIAFAMAPNHRFTRQMALVLVIIAAPSALITVYNAWNGWIGIFFDGIPGQAVWRVLITPAIRTIYWLSQILFLWTDWGKPQAQKPIETFSARLAL